MSEENRTRIIFIAVSAVCILAFIGVVALCLTMFYKSYADPAVLTAIIAITTGLVGSLSTIIGFRSPPSQVPPPNGATTEIPAPKKSVTVTPDASADPAP